MGDAYTVVVMGQQTGGRYTLIDMLVQTGGGPGPHRHDFGEMFNGLEGEIELPFRGKILSARTGETVNILGGAPHQFINKTDRTARLLRVCAPSGQEEFFMAVGTPVATRTTPAPQMSEAERAAFLHKAAELAPGYRTELLQHA